MLRRRGRGQLVGREPGGERLQVPAPRTGALARRAVDVDRDVAELAGRADGAAVEAAVEDQAAADPGAEREHDHVLRTRGPRRAGARRPQRRFRRSRSSTGTPKRAWSRSRRSTPASGMFTEVTARPGALVDRRRNADAERAKPLARRAASMTRSSCARTDSSPARSVGSTVRLNDRPVAVHEPGGQLRPAQVDRDDVAERSFGVWLRYSVAVASKDKPYRRLSRRAGQGPRSDRARRRSGRSARRRRRQGRLHAPEAHRPAAPQASLAADRAVVVLVIVLACPWSGPSSATSRSAAA